MRRHRLTPGQRTALHVLRDAEAFSPAGALPVGFGNVAGESIACQAVKHLWRRGLVERTPDEKGVFLTTAGTKEANA